MNILLCLNNRLNSENDCYTHLWIYTFKIKLEILTYENSISYVLTNLVEY